MHQRTGKIKRDYQGSAGWKPAPKGASAGWQGNALSVEEFPGQNSTMG
jgi:hypothetical protein